MTGLISCDLLPQQDGGVGGAAGPPPLGPPDGVPGSVPGRGVREVPPGVLPGQGLQSGEIFSATERSYYRRP